VSPVIPALHAVMQSLTIAFINSSRSENTWSIQTFLCAGPIITLKRTFWGILVDLADQESFRKMLKRTLSTTFAATTSYEDKLSLF